MVLFNFTAAMLYNSLLLAFQRFHGHVDEAVFCFAIGECTKSRDCPLRVVLSQRSCLFYSVALDDQVACLFNLSQPSYHTI